jgi:hypothetical protein
VGKFVLSCNWRGILGGVIGFMIAVGKLTDGGFWFGRAVGSSCEDGKFDPPCFHQTVDPNNAVTSRAVIPHEIAVNRLSLNISISFFIHLP